VPIAVIVIAFQCHSLYTLLQSVVIRPVTTSVLIRRWKAPEVPDSYEGWNFNSGNYLFTTDTK